MYCSALPRHNVSISAFTSLGNIFSLTHILFLSNKFNSLNSFNAFFLFIYFILEYFIVALSFSANMNVYLD